MTNQPRLPPTYVLCCRCEQCKVLGYDHKRKRFQIRFGRDDRNPIKHVKRLNLRFAIEDKEAFQARLDYCNRGREAVKAKMRMEHFLGTPQSAAAAPLQGRPKRTAVRQIRRRARRGFEGVFV